jgi:hypothetical protein
MNLNELLIRRAPHHGEASHADNAKQAEAISAAFFGADAWA